MKYLILSFCILFFSNLKAQEITPPINDGHKKEPLTYVDEMPSFPGDGYEVWLKKNIKKPDTDTIIDGVVYIQLVIDETGKVASYRVIKSLHPAYDAEAMRLMSLMPDWTPGKQNGKPVPVKLNIPVKFGNPPNPQMPPKKRRK